MGFTMVNNNVIKTDSQWFPKPWGYPNSWMVYNMENPTRLDDDWGYPEIFGNLQISQIQNRSCLETQGRRSGDVIEIS